MISHKVDTYLVKSIRWKTRPVKWSGIGPLKGAGLKLSRYRCTCYQEVGAYGVFPILIVGHSLIQQLQVTVIDSQALHVIKLLLEGININAGGLFTFPRPLIIIIMSANVQCALFSAANPSLNSSQASNKRLLNCRAVIGNLLHPAPVSGIFLSSWFECQTMTRRACLVGGESKQITGPP